MDQRRFVALTGMLGILMATLVIGGPAAVAQSVPVQGTAGTAGTVGAADIAGNAGTAGNTRAASVVGAASSASDRGRGGDWNRHPERFDYYLALGDSLSRGVQPNVSGQSLPTNQGYADDLAAQLRRANRHLDFVDLGCPGETTTTMLVGGCPFPHSYTSQLAAAVSFLKAHRNARVLVTLNIGSNNVDGCIGASGIDLACVQAGLTSMATDLPKLLGALKAAAGRHVEFAAMNYYDPFLASWLTGPAGQQEAVESVQLLGQLNGILGAAYKAFGIPVADVASRFDSTDFTPLVPLTPTLQVPLNVARVCQWTWMCAPPPVGPNIHANKAGYEEIADAFEAVLFGHVR